MFSDHFPRFWLCNFLLQDQVFSEHDAFFAWTFVKRRPFWQTLLSFCWPVLTLAICLFPVYPHQCKLLILYSCAGVLLLILSLLLCRSYSPFHWFIFCIVLHLLSINHLYDVLNLRIAAWSIVVGWYHQVFECFVLICYVWFTYFPFFFNFVIFWVFQSVYVHLGHVGLLHSHLLLISAASSCYLYFFSSSSISFFIFEK